MLCANVLVSCFTPSLYTCRSQKCKKDSQLKQLFELLGSAGVKAACKHIDEIDPRVNRPVLQVDDEVSVFEHFSH